ncbi:MAG: sulfatase family protein [Pyrinomonadaceae bacterium]
MISRRELIKTLGTTAAGLTLGSFANTESSAQARPMTSAAPNIIFIMTDDQQQSAMSAYGNTILKTPNLDRIGAEGTRFTEMFVTNSLCAPSRASFLTGLYSHTHGVTTNGASGSIFSNQPGLKNEQETFVHLLRRAGYHNALVGKWHLRSLPTGFDQWIILPGGGGPYTDPEMITNGMRMKFRGHADDVVGDQALTFLQQRPKDRPFCLLYNFKAPHRNWLPAARFEKVFDNIEIPIPRSFNDSFEGRPQSLRKTEMAVADMPDFRNRGVAGTLPPDERKRQNFQQLAKNYYRTLLGVDENVGRVLDFLDKNNLSNDTLVIYSSDNGFFLGEHGLFDKRLMYEPSIRVPLLVRLPSRVKSGQVNSRHMVLNIDVAPTLLEMAGVPVPPWMQGRSFLPQLEGRQIPWRDAFLYEYYEYPAEHCARKNRGIRTERWKLIHFWEQPEEWELYDLKNDPEEMNNLYSQPDHEKRVRELRSHLEMLRRETNDLETPGPAAVAAPCVAVSG